MAGRPGGRKFQGGQHGSSQRGPAHGAPEWVEATALTSPDGAVIASLGIVAVAVGSRRSPIEVAVSNAWIQPKSSGKRVIRRSRAASAGPSGRCSRSFVARELRLDGTGPRDTQRLVAGQHRLEPVQCRAGQELGQRDRVLDRRVRPLAVVRQHRVRRVAEQHHPAAAPAQQRAADEKSPAKPVLHGADHLGDRGMPTLEGSQRLAGLAFGLPAVAMRPVRRALDDGQEIDVLAPTANGVVEEMRARPHPELDGLRVRQRGQTRGRHDAAESAGAGVDRALAAGNEAPDQRADAIRPDCQVRLSNTAVGEAELDAVPVVDEVRQAMAEMQPFTAERAAKDALQVGAMDTEIGRAETLPVAAVLADRVRRDPPPVPTVAKDQLGRLGGGGESLVQHSRTAAARAWHWRRAPPPPRSQSIPRPVRRPPPRGRAAAMRGRASSHQCRRLRWQSAGPLRSFAPPGSSNRRGQDLPRPQVWQRHPAASGEAAALPRMSHYGLAGPTAVATGAASAGAPSRPLAKIAIPASSAGMAATANTVASDQPRLSR